MNTLEVRRVFNSKTNGYSISHLYWNGERLVNSKGKGLDVVEDVDRGLDQSMKPEEIKKKKIYAKTAIPVGTYKLSLDIVSPKFSKDSFYRNVCDSKVPRLLSVPGYDGILIHCGNSAKGSAGCLLVGRNTIKGSVTESKNSFTDLCKMYLLPNKKAGIRVVITRTYTV